MKNKLISLSVKTILLESGMSCYSDVRNISTYRSEVLVNFGIDLRPLVYGRNPTLNHTLVEIIAGDKPLKPTDLVRNLNQQGLPFNLALNGSPSFDRSVPLNSEELDFLFFLQNIGTDYGMQNSVTIADDALRPVIRREFTELEIVASCIAPQFKPNIDWFRNAFPGISNNEELLIKYYEYLYAKYDKVVPMAQLSNPKFLGHFTQIAGALADKTIVFLDLQCAQQNIGGCSGHYFNNRINVKGMPTIPNTLYNDELGSYATGEDINSRCRTNHNHILINRPTDVLWMLNHGIWQYKVPARNSNPLNNVERFLMLTKATDPVTKFPDKNQLWGDIATDIKINFLLSYPEKVWSVLETFHWQRPNKGLNDFSYIGVTAREIQAELHAKAVEMWEQ